MIRYLRQHGRNKWKRPRDYHQRRLVLQLQMRILGVENIIYNRLDAYSCGGERPGKRADASLA